MTGPPLLVVALAVLVALGSPPAGPATSQGEPVEIHVHPDKGRAGGKGTERSPCRTISGAIARLPEPLDRDVTIRLAAGRYPSTGANGMPEGTLRLDHRMKGATRVRIIGPPPAGDGGDDEDATTPRAVLDWESSERPFLVEAFEGRWSLENVQVGTRRKAQRQGISVRGPSELELANVTVRVRSFSGAGLYAHAGGHIRLAGRIALNEDFHGKIPEEESFAGIVAEDHGTVRFTGREGASLSIGNGSLAAGYYGVIRLGCETAEITSWGGQSNCIAVNNSGRVDLHGTETTLRARKASNSPIGLEDDGHVLAEGARIIIDVTEEGGSGIVLQKSSALYCQDVEFRGKTPKYYLVAYSGSDFGGGFRGDLGAVTATTGATVSVGTCTGELIGPFRALKGGRLTLPDGRELPGRE